MVKGNVGKIIFAHDTVRVIECLVAQGDETIRNALFDEMKDEDSLIIKDSFENPPNVYGFGHKSYYQDIVNSILEKTNHKVDGLEGKKSVEIISAIYESMETKKEVYLRFKPEKCKLGMRL